MYYPFFSHHGHSLNFITVKERNYNASRFSPRGGAGSGEAFTKIRETGSETKNGSKQQTTRAK